MCKIFDCTKSSLIDGISAEPKREMVLTPDELSIIQKYRTIDERGRENVRATLDTEYQRMEKKKEATEHSA